MNEYGFNDNNETEFNNEHSSLNSFSEQENNTDGQFATYSQTYTPISNGYSQHSSEGSYNHSSYYDSSNSYTSSGPYGNAKNKKNGAKTALIVALICGFVAVASAFSLIGFSVAKYSITEYSESKESIVPNTENETTDKSQNAGLDANDIIKNEHPETSAPQGTIGEIMTKAQVVSLVQKSVVEITTEKTVTGSYFQQYISSGAGSGVIISDKGYIVTNNHVIDGADTITVRLSNGNEYIATVIGTDASADIAVIKIRAEEALTVAILGNSERLLVGEEILVIGNPLGQLGGSVTNGIISALDREIAIDGETMTLLQTNAAVNPGNSGGGMFNLYGELVGIINAKSSGTDVEGLGFAIPIDTAYSVVLQLMEYGYVLGRIDHGLDLIDINDIYTAMSYHVSTYGVYVLNSKYTDDIKNGDRIVSVNGMEVSSSADIKTALKDCHVGDSVSINVSRKGKLLDVKLTLREYVPSNDGDVEFGQ